MRVKRSQFSFLSNTLVCDNLVDYEARTHKVHFVSQFIEEWIYTLSILYRKGHPKHDKCDFKDDLDCTIITINQKRESLEHEVVLTTIFEFRYLAITKLRECGG